jgi:methylmalonyl-CoA mutase C-terminal domain/subunit
LAKKEKPIKVLMAKTNLDGHWRGPVVVSTALRDAGMEVVYGRQLNPAEIAETAMQEDVDVIGLNVCGRYDTVSELIRILKDKRLDDKLVVAGGTIPPADIKLLRGMGVAGVFPPGSSMNAIVNFIQENVGRDKKKTRTDKE